MNYNAPGEMNTMNNTCKNVMCSITGIPQKQSVYKVKRAESEFTLLMRPDSKNIQGDFKTYVTHFYFAVKKLNLF